MNLILFQDSEDFSFLLNEDPRAIHISEVLRMGVGDSFYMGIVNGHRGLAKIIKASKEGLWLNVEWEDAVFSYLPIHLIIGMVRPQTARKILLECTALGFQSITFFSAEKSEPSYSKSKLWQTDEWRKRLMQGAEQAFVTIIPDVRCVDSLEAAISCSDYSSTSFALDNYEGTSHLAAKTDFDLPVTLVIGPERGWSASERDFFRTKGFELVDLGDRVLCAETACVAAIGLLLGKV